MAERTAAGWNERHPPGSVVWYPTTDGPRLGMQWGIAADEFDDYGQPGPGELPYREPWWYGEEPEPLLLAAGWRRHREDPTGG